MGKQIIMRPVFNRPEMFKLSLEYEIKAREYFDIGEEFTTLFIVEHGSPQIIHDLIAEYPYEHDIIQREERFGLSMNILEGFKDAFWNSDDYVIYIEDDILLHKTYFKYLKLILDNSELSNFSVISPYNFTDTGSVNMIRKERHYAALAPLISKDFYERYILRCSNEDFYARPAQFVMALNNKYQKYQHDRTYRYKDTTHFQQAGLINRLCDCARIDDDMYVVMPDINRIQHIGIYGHNRIKGKEIPGNTFEDRVESLREIIKDPVKMYDMAGSKEYNDYMAFSPKLNGWDGTLKISDKHFTS